jgi:thiamine pyrophosphate-dependent acetolactate synthase large subunit-like protein
MAGVVDEAVVVANGYLSRLAFRSRDLPTTFYMIGSMGLASSIGLGVALVRPERRVLVIDGDGNLLMALGALAMIGNLRPKNLIHLVIDNEVYASTGGQRSISRSVAMPELALASGYRTAAKASDEPRLRVALRDMWIEEGPHFLQVKVDRGIEIAPRVSSLPAEIATSFKQSLAGGSA